MHSLVARGRRLDGVDAARGLALVGMFIAHVAPAVSSPQLAALLAIADERPRLLFALTAGVGLGLLTGGTGPTHDATNRAVLRRQIAIRALVLVALGLGIAITLNPLVFIILDVYGIAFLLLLPLIFIGPRTALVTGAIGLALAPGLASWLSTTPTIITAQQSSASLLIDWAVSGAYPVIIWIPVMLIGLGLARLDLARPRVIMTTGIAGVAAASITLPASALLVGAMGEPASDAWLVPLHTSLETIGNVAVGAAVLAACLGVLQAAHARLARSGGTRLGRGGAALARGILAPFIAMGAMPLSIYTLHLVVLALAIRVENGVPTDNSWALTIGLIFGAMLFALSWRRWIGRGPLEMLLRLVSGRGHPAPAPASPTSPPPASPPPNSQ